MCKKASTETTTAPAACLLAIPTDLLRAALFGVAPPHEWPPVLRSLRATNRQLLSLCCVLAVEVDEAVQAKALSVLTRFSLWTKSNDRQLPSHSDDGVGADVYDGASKGMATISPSIDDRARCRSRSPQTDER